MIYWIKFLIVCGKIGISFFRVQKYIFSGFTYSVGLFVFPLSFLIFVEDNRELTILSPFNDTFYEECDS